LEIKPCPGYKGGLLTEMTFEIGPETDWNQAEEKEAHSKQNCWVLCMKAGWRVESSEVCSKKAGRVGKGLIVEGGPVRTCKASALPLNYSLSHKEPVFKGQI
jgi:hypothetical protein